jgi:hypothetical protein
VRRLKKTRTECRCPNQVRVPKIAGWSGLKNVLAVLIGCGVPSPSPRPSPLGRGGSSSFADRASRKARPVSGQAEFLPLLGERAGVRGIAATIRQPDHRSFETALTRFGFDSDFGFRVSDFTLLGRASSRRLLSDVNRPSPATGCSRAPSDLFRQSSLRTIHSRTARRDDCPSRSKSARRTAAPAHRDRPP